MTVTWLLLAISAAVIAQVVREVLAYVAGKLGPALIHRAADRLPAQRRDIRHAEWLAEFEWLVQRSAHFLCLRYAVGVWVGAVRIGRETSKAENRRWKEWLFELCRPSAESIAEGDLAFVAYLGIVTSIALPAGWVLVRLHNDFVRGFGTSCFIGAGVFVITALATIARHMQLVLRKRRRPQQAD